MNRSQPSWVQRCDSQGHYFCKQNPTNEHELKGSSMTASEFFGRVRDAVEKGQQAFWRVVAESFPEAPGGDFSPEATFALEKSLFLAVLSWTRNNLPVNTVRATKKTLPLQKMSAEEWATEAFHAWLANDKARLAKLMALDEEDSDGR